MKVWKKFVVLALCLLSVTFTKASSTANAKSKFLEEYQRTMSSRIKELQSLTEMRGNNKRLRRALGKAIKEKTRLDQSLEDIPITKRQLKEWKKQSKEYKHELLAFQASCYPESLEEDLLSLELLKDTKEPSTSSSSSSKDDNHSDIESDSDKDSDSDSDSDDSGEHVIEAVPELDQADDEQSKKENAALALVTCAEGVERTLSGLIKTGQAALKENSKLSKDIPEILQKVRDNLKDLKEKLSSEKILGESGEKTVVTTTTTTSTAGSTDTSNKKGIKRKSPVRSNLSNSKESSLGNSKKNSNGKEVETGSSSPQTKEEISKDSVGKLLKEITSTLEAAESFLELMNTNPKHFCFTLRRDLLPPPQGIIGCIRNFINSESSLLSTTQSVACEFVEKIDSIAKVFCSTSYGFEKK